MTLSKDRLRKFTALQNQQPRLTKQFLQEENITRRLPNG